MSSSASVWRLLVVTALLLSVRLAAGADDAIPGSSVDIHLDRVDTNTVYFNIAKREVEYVYVLGLLDMVSRTNTNLLIRVFVADGVPVKDVRLLLDDVDRRGLSNCQLIIVSGEEGARLCRRFRKVDTYWSSPPAVSPVPDLSPLLKPLAKP